METPRGIDRIVIGVRDLDRATAFFSRMFDAEFIELKGPGVEAMEQRASISFKAHIELLSPLSPLTDKAPPFMKRLAMVLEEKDYVLVGLSYRVDDIARIASDLERKGIRIESNIESDEFDEILSWRNARELVVNDDDTLGILFAFIEYESV